MFLPEAKNRGELDSPKAKYTMKSRPERSKAVFLDRDGVLNELVHYQDHGIIDSPFTAEQFRLFSGVGEAVKRLRDAGYKVILISNQPGIAKGHMSEETFDRIRQKMKDELAKDGAFLNKEYYCFHHPEAKIERLKANCECRKPKSGLLLQAALEMGIDLPYSWMIGDGLTDIRAGKDAGTRTILLGRIKCQLCHLMDDEDARPGTIASNLAEAAKFILKERG